MKKGLLKSIISISLIGFSTIGCQPIKWSSAPLSPVYDVKWSPDNSKLAFTSIKDNNHEIYTINSDGSELTRITNSETETDFSPVWSKDGKSIYYLTKKESESYKKVYLNKISLEEKSISKVNTFEESFNSANRNSSVSLSKNAEKLVYLKFLDNKTEAYYMNIDGSEKNKIELNNNEGILTSWSQDANKLLVNIENYQDLINKKYKLRVIDTKTNYKKEIDFKGNKIDSSISPNGNKIAVIEEPMGSIGLSTLYVMEIDGSNKTKVSDVRFSFIPVWSKDSEKLIFSTEEKENFTNIVSINDINNRKPFNDKNNLIVYNDTNFTWSNDMSKVAYISNGNIVISNEDGTESKKITNFEMITISN